MIKLAIILAVLGVIGLVTGCGSEEASGSELESPATTIPDTTSRVDGSVDSASRSDQQDVPALTKPPEGAR